MRNIFFWFLMMLSSTALYAQDRIPPGIPLDGAIVGTNYEIKNITINEFNQVQTATIVSKSGNVICKMNKFKTIENYQIADCGSWIISVYYMTAEYDPWYFDNSGEFSDDCTVFVFDYFKKGSKLSFATNMVAVGPEGGVEDQTGYMEGTIYLNPEDFD
ncbi:MAG: hypothetical protein KDK51_01050 [Deltaproteobacteria bacterium]|nr:hypothetical protein [Deltaproteobacteria bacterium]